MWKEVKQMKKADGYILKKLEDEYVILPYGK